MDKDAFVHEDMLKAAEYTLLGKLPDPFMMSNGQRVSSAADWRQRRMEIRNSALNLLYGPMPPEPEFLETEAICDYRYSGSSDAIQDANHSAEGNQEKMSGDRGRGSVLCL